MMSEILRSKRAGKALDALLPRLQPYQNRVFFKEIGTPHADMRHVGLPIGLRHARSDWISLMQKLDVIGDDEVTK